MSKKKGINKILRLIPLGGLGEIGRNMMAYEYGDSILVVDCGLMFPENDMLGIDYIIPDISYLAQRKDRVKAIIFTHGHEDHIGSAQHFVEQIQAPIYATPLTRGLLDVKLARSGVGDKVEIHTVQAGDTIDLDPFKVELFHMAHSIPDCVGLGIDTPAGLVVHSGDFKFDHTPVDGWPSDFAKLAEFSQRGVLALLADSTNATEPGWTPSEMVVDDAFDHVFREAQGRIIIASFASLISRMQQVVNAAQRYQRKLAFVGTSMVDNAKMALKQGYLHAPESLLVNLEQAVGMKPKQVVIMCTGSQGEPTSVLGRLSMGAYRHFDIREGDTVVLSSQVIPGNEEKVYGTINRLYRSGAQVIYEKLAPVHVSGHASQEEIKLLLNIVRPQYFVPIHGELRHLKQSARLAVQVGIPESNIAVVENGQVIEFRDGQMRLGEQVPYRYVFVDGSGVGDVGPEVMRAREIMGQNGIVIVDMLLQRADLRLMAVPSVQTYGLMMEEEVENMEILIRQRISEVVQDDGRDVEKAVEQAVRTLVYAETRRRPRIFVTINWLD